MSRIHYTKPSITEKEVAYATEAARDGWGAKCYDFIYRFEAAFRDHLGVEFALATSSCTGALHLGLSAAGIGEGDEVIVADINWIASVAPVVHLGAVPVFVDVLEDTWCIDPDRAEAAITPRTRAIMAVHIYGNLAALDALRDIAHRHGLILIEDAAEALGSTWGTSPAGSLGTFGTFSFHGTKTMTTGEGGMFVTNDQALFDRVQALNNHGRMPGQTKQFWADMVGFKYKMSNVQAAIGCAQIERVGELIDRKRQIFAEYQSRLADLPLAMNPSPPQGQNGYWMPTIVAERGSGFDRERLLQRFVEREIDGRIFFWPLSMLPMFERREDNVVSYSLFERAVNLPSYHDMTTSDIERVCTALREEFA